MAPLTSEDTQDLLSLAPAYQYLTSSLPITPHPTRSWNPTTLNYSDFLTFCMDTLPFSIVCSPETQFSLSQDPDPSALQPSYGLQLAAL